jgi:hypothetical protein
MSTTTFEQLKKLWEEFETNHVEFTEKGKKVAAKRARAAIGEIKKLVTEYRRESVEASK